MGKKKDAKRAAKAAGGAVRLPKRIAGVKLPREMRLSGEALLAKANSPAGRQVIASGLTMAAAAASAALARHRAEPDAAAKPGAPGTGTSPPIAPDAIVPDPIADAIGAAADAVLVRLFGARRPG